MPGTSTLKLAACLYAAKCDKSCCSRAGQKVCRWHDLYNIGVFVVRSWLQLRPVVSRHHFLLASVAISSGQNSPQPTHFFSLWTKEHQQRRQPAANTRRCRPGSEVFPSVQGGHHDRWYPFCVDGLNFWVSLHCLRSASAARRLPLRLHWSALEVVRRGAYFAWWDRS